MEGKGNVVVIGSGAAGRGAARALAGAGWRVVIVDKDRVGGTCLWRGCIPKKALYTAARSVRDAQRAVQFGVTCADVGVDWQQVLAWKWHAQETFAGDQKALLENRGIGVVEGTARFVSPDEVEIAGKTVRPDYVVLATGSRPVMPEVPGIELAEDSDSALRFPSLPSALTIVGGGFIAMELAGIFASFGTRVTIVERGSRVLSMLDAELAAVAHRRLQSMGAEILTGSTFEGIVGEPARLAVQVTGDSGARALESEHVVVAAGRHPVTDGLDLDSACIELDERGRFVIDANMRTTNPKVWVCGDATGGMMETPVANMEGAVVAHSIDSGCPEPPDCGAVPVTCFTTPQLATVGLTESDATAKGIATRVTRVCADSIGAAIVDDERDFLAKLVIAQAGGKVLGAQVAGPTASDVIYAAAVAVAGGMTDEQLQRVIGVHPSYAESVYYAAW